MPPPRAAEPLYQALDEILGGEAAGAGQGGAVSSGTGAASLGADHAESTWHGYLARHTRHRRHHIRRRGADAAAAAAAAAAATAATAATAVAVGGGGHEEEEEVYCK